MRSPDSIIVNQIDHLAFSRIWRSSLQDVRVLRWADLGSEHHQAKDCQSEKRGEWPSAFRGQQAERLAG